MRNFFATLPKGMRGLLIMVAGLILLLHTMGILEEWLDTAIIVASIGLVVYGFMMAGLHTKIMGYIKGMKKGPYDEPPYPT